MHHRIINRHSDGFTLVEVLIALTLTVVMTALLFGALHTYAKAGAVGRAHLASKDKAQSVRQFIRTQVREIVPLALRDRRNPHNQQALFHGDNEKIIYVSQIPSHRSAGGLHKNALFTERSESGVGLSFAYERLAPSADDDLKSDTAAFAERLPDTARTLIQGADSISFEYFGASGSRDERAWYDTWENSRQLPELVRLRIEHDNLQEAEELVVRIYNFVPTNHIALTLGGGGQTRQSTTSRDAPAEPAPDRIPAGEGTQQ